MGLGQGKGDSGGGFGDRPVVQPGGGVPRQFFIKPSRLRQSLMGRLQQMPGVILPSNRPFGMVGVGQNRHFPLSPFNRWTR